MWTMKSGAEKVSRSAEVHWNRGKGDGNLIYYARATRRVLLARGYRVLCTAVRVH
jgi:hypothetical protein